MRHRSAASRRHLSSSPFNEDPVAPEVEAFAVEDRVTHDTYGLGRVLEVEGDSAVIVAFASQNVRVSTPFTKLTKL